jgi:hypothetical protein
MAEFLAAHPSYQGSIFPSNSDDQGVVIMLYRSSNLPSMIDKVTDSLTNMIRNTGDRTLIADKLFQEPTFIDIEQV